MFISLRGNILECRFFNEVVDKFKEFAANRFSSGLAVVIIQLAKVVYFEGIILLK